MEGKGEMPDEVTETTETSATITETVDVAGLKSALEKERTIARDNKAAAKERDALRAELEQIKGASASDSEKALAQARKDAATETKTELMSQVTAALVTANIRAAAGGRLTDPDDAVRLLDTSEFELDDSFNLDAAKVTKAIDDLLAAKPYLGTAKDDGKVKRTGFDLGPRADAPTATDARSLIAAGLADTSR